MQILTSSHTVPAPAPAATAPSFRAPAGRELALFDQHGVGFFRLFDTLTGYGRPHGYDSLANARRAAYQLTKGDESPAAGIFQQGSRFYVRALGTQAGMSPHESTPGAPEQARRGLDLLHFEGNAQAHFAWVAAKNLVLIVDGATKIWSRDAHHPAPTR